MEKLVLKNSTLEVSRLCFGGCPLGGHGWGKTQRNELLRSVQDAYDLGINFFDTADIYGKGESENILGEALHGKRDKVILASKFGVVLPQSGSNGKTYYDNSPEYIEQAIVGTLKRLNTDYLDLYQLHYRDDCTPIATVVETLEKLKDKGIIRYFGLSNVKREEIEELKEFQNRFVSFQNEFSLATRRNEDEIREIATQLNLTPMTWGSLGQGILTGKYDESTVFETDDRRSRDVYSNFYGAQIAKNLRIVQVMKEISQRTGKTMPAIAIRWILDVLKDSVVIAGIKCVAQIEDNFQGLMWSLSEEDLHALDVVSKEEEHAR